MIFLGRKKFFSKYFIDFFDRFLAVFFEILRMQLDFFFVWFLDFFSILLFFFNREKKKMIFLMTGLAIEFFLYTCRFFLLSSNYTRRIKNSASSSNYPSGRKRFHRSKRCKGKSPLHGVPEKEIKNRILFVIFFVKM